jgi:hypothetical protein
VPYRFLAPGLLLLAGAAAGPTTPVRICLAPTTMEPGSVADAAGAVRETLSSFLTGPNFTLSLLDARLESQARDEAKASACPYVVFSRVKHVRKSGGTSVLKRVAATAVQDGAWSAGSHVNSAAGRAAADVTAAAAGSAAANYAIYSVKSKDELTLTYRLESAAGTALLDKSEKHKAESDGEDLLTPMVQQAAEAIVSALSATQH